jgi:hypothetical protein
MEEILKEASLLQYPDFVVKRSAWQFLGHREQSFNASRGSRKEEKSIGRNGDLLLLEQRYGNSQYG